MAFQDCTTINELSGWSLPETGCFNIQLSEIQLNRFSNLDLAGTTAVTDATGAICLNAVAATVPFVKVGFDGETAQLSWQKTSDNGYYEVTLTIPAGGISKEIWAGMRALCKGCGIVAHICSNDCTNLFVGADWTGTEFKRQYAKSGYVSDHSGSIGNGDPTNTITLTWKMCDAPYLSNLECSAVPTA